MKQKEFFRPIFQVLRSRLQERRQFMQVLVGPRQVGKTTLALQAINDLGTPYHYASADEPGLQPEAWLAQQWAQARMLAKNQKAVLVLDEVQKMPDWSSVVKQLWDEDSRSKLELQVVLLGSSRLLIQTGLSESLTGRFEQIHVPHWTLSEMREAFGWSVEQFTYFGGYPGAAKLIKDEERWSRYVLDALIETTISRDVLLMSRVNKPALLRRLFHLGCNYSGQILSYQKMMGQLQDAGNTTTLAHYLELLSAAGLLSGIEKYAQQAMRVRSSSPKWQVQDTALMSVHMRHTFQTAQKDGEDWGRLVESAVGAHLVNETTGSMARVYYWRENNHEVDFILEDRGALVAIEVKSGNKKAALGGMKEFLALYPRARPLLVGAQGIGLETFLSTPVRQWFAD